MNNIPIGKVGSRAFNLPIDFTTQTSAILARKGAGKTYCGQVEAEGLLQVNQQIIVIDPLDAWWGLRSSADGKRPGFEIVIFGGEHGDLPLEENMAPGIATLVAENPALSCVFSLRHMRKGRQRQFITDFAENLFHLKGKSKLATPVHLFIDESDSFAPQRVYKGAERMLGAMEDLVRRGRQAGIGITMITQRPQSLNKDVLTQAELLIVGQITGPHDKKAIQEWIKENADDRRQSEFMSSLATLKVGQLWFWSPSWLGKLSLVTVNKKRTFDSSATPKAGKKRKAPKKSAKVNLKTIRSKLKGSVEVIQQNDPKALKRRIAELERDLKKKSPKIPESPKQQIIHQGFTREEVIEFVNQAQKKCNTYWQEKIVATGKVVPNLHTRIPKQKPVKVVKTVPVLQKQRLVASTLTQTPTPPPVSAPVLIGSLPRCERTILTVLAQKGKECSKRLVAIQSGYSFKSGGFNNALSKLRTLGYINGRGDIAITNDGIEVLGSYDPLPTGFELIDYWKGKLPKCERTILEVITSACPGALGKDEIGEIAGYSSNSGGFNNALSRLRTLELIQGRGEVMLSEEIFE